MKTANGTTTYFLYDGGTPLLEETYSGSSATISALNVWAADGWRSRYYPALGDFSVFTFDPQGNVVNRQDGLNTSSAIVDTSVYEAYGKRTANIGPSGTSPSMQEPAGFGGQYGYYTDRETGLLCLTHRYYDPGTGRFVNRDPIGYQGGVNLYGFAGGNPVNESDPSGFDAGGAGANGGDGYPIHRTPRISSARMRRIWEKAYNQKVPIDPETGNHYDMAHKNALERGGDNSAENLEPKTHEEHVNEHKQAGDYKQWGAKGAAAAAAKREAAAEATRKLGAENVRKLSAEAAKELNEEVEKDAEAKALAMAKTLEEARDLKQLQETRRTFAIIGAMEDLSNE